MHFHLYDAGFSCLSRKEEMELEYFTTTTPKVSFKINSVVAIGLSRAKFDLATVTKDFTNSKFEVLYMTRKKRASEISPMKAPAGQSSYYNSIHKNCIIYQVALCDNRVSDTEVDHIKTLLKEIF